MTVGGPSVWWDGRRDGASEGGGGRGEGDVVSRLCKVVVVDGRSMLAVHPVAMYRRDVRMGGSGLMKNGRLVRHWD